MKLSRAEQQLFAGLSRKDAVISVLRAGIVDGRLAPGQRLDQNEIAATLGVSRMPVREALKQLEGERLVVVYPYRGVEVAQLDRDCIVELFGIRTTLERLAVGRAVPLLNAANFNRMQSILKRMDESLETKEGVDDPWMKLNAEFHNVINKASGWPRLVDTIEQFRGNVERYVRFYLAHLGRAQSQREHWALYEACLHRDSSAAQEIIEEHLANTADSLIEAIAAAQETGSRPITAGARNGRRLNLEMNEGTE